MSDVRQGETVSIAYGGLSFSLPGPTGASVILKDANGNTRVLASNERLVIDSMSITLIDASGGECGVTVYANGAVPATAGDVVIFAGASSQDNNSVTVLNANIHVPSEGISIPAGVTPFVSTTLTDTSDYFFVVGTG